MTRPSKPVKVKDVVADKVLEEIVVAPTPVINPNRYVEANRYVTATPARAADRYIAATAAARPASRYAMGRRYSHINKVVRPGRKITRHITIFVPPSRHTGQLLWLPAIEFEQCYDEGIGDADWGLGDIFDFDEATESRAWQMGCCEPGSGDVCEDHCDSRIWVGNVDEEQDTFLPGFWDRESERWPELMELAAQFRKELAADPDQVVQVLRWDGYSVLAHLAGMTRTPVPMEVVAAVRSDPQTGLGAAALDFAVWRIPEFFGHSGAQLSEWIEEIEGEEYVGRAPIENILFHTDQLHPDTHGELGGWRNRMKYAIHGDYVVTKVNYHSDPTGRVVAGWRSLFVEPIVRQQR